MDMRTMQDPAGRLSRQEDATNAASHPVAQSAAAVPLPSKSTKGAKRWSMGVMEDPETTEVPGSVLLLSNVSKVNAPLGMRNTPLRNSASSLPSPYPQATQQSEAMFRRSPAVPEKKCTADGQIILEPQPEDSVNDPLNWSPRRRDVALLSLGLYCMVSGGMTPILAAGFTNVAQTYNVSIPQVALTTGLYMLGLGVGSVLASPTAIIIGKRPVYLFTAILFICSAVWCALSPSYTSLVIARVFQGIAVSPAECLPSATIAEIFFLHERAYRLGIYTLLLLGGKNLVPLVSAAIIQRLGWQWVFWIVAMVVAFCGVLLFFFVPETFWDRTPRPHKHHSRPGLAGLRKFSSQKAQQPQQQDSGGRVDDPSSSTAPDGDFPGLNQHGSDANAATGRKRAHFGACDGSNGGEDEYTDSTLGKTTASSSEAEDTNLSGIRVGNGGRNHASLPRLVIPNDSGGETAPPDASGAFTEQGKSSGLDPEKLGAELHGSHDPDMIQTRRGLKPNRSSRWTNQYRSGPPKSYLQTLKPWDGRLGNDNWFRVALRPFVLFAYPAVLWSAAVYALSVGWLIVLSESASEVYRSRDTYNFSALSTGLIYISPFLGGILGTAVAGKVSDVLVKMMSRRNGGIYEPEFRLIMAIPVAFTTSIGLMGYGWSAQARDAWIVPTVFFGIISFGCSLGSTTAITFCVDSYRQYAGEALVTLNFSKNVLHGLVFSLFFNRWLEAEGAKSVFLALGGIQLGVLLFTIPLYIYGKRARMWTVRRNLMEIF